MSLTAEIERNIAETLCGGIRVVQKGLERYEVITPFTFDDGDVLPIILKRKGDGWEITDEGRTFLYLSYYDIDMNYETRKNVLSKILSSHFMEGGDDGILKMPRVSGEDLAHAVYTFAQGVIKASDFSIWKKEFTRRLFMEGFREFMEELGRTYPTEFQYHDKQLDPKKIYPIDCSLLLTNSKRVNLFAVSGDSKAKNSVITMMHYERFKAPFTNCVLFENEEVLARKTLIQVADVADKTFSSLEVARDRLRSYLEKNAA